MMPASTCLDPNHRIISVVPFIKNIMIGIIIAIARVVNKEIEVMSLFALSNLASSRCSLLNARMTNIPSNNSRTTLFILSIIFCMILNFGITIIKIANTTLKMITTHKARIQVILAPDSITCSMAPIPMIGAYMTILKNIATVICSC